MGLLRREPVCAFTRLTHAPLTQFVARVRIEARQITGITADTCLRPPFLSGQSAVVHDLPELALAYWETYAMTFSGDRTDRLKGEESWWAWEEVEERVRLHPEDSIEVLTYLADTAPDDAALAYLGAGPIEDLVCYGGSDVVIDRVEGAAVRNGNFRKALRCAWFDAHVEPSVAKRLRRFGDPY